MDNKELVVVDKMAMLVCEQGHWHLMVQFTDSDHETYGIEKQICDPYEGWNDIMDLIQSRAFVFDRGFNEGECDGIVD